MSGALSLQPMGEVAEPGADAVDVPGDDFHAGSDCVRRTARRAASPSPQMEKLVPQPQDATAFGFLIWKDWPIRSSTKSITEPPI